MQLLLAALIAAASPSEEEGSQPGEATLESPQHAEEKPAQRTEEVFALAAAGSRGERRAEVGVRVKSEDFLVFLGAAETGGPRAPQRQEIVAGAGLGPVRGELRGVPGSGGLWRVAAEAGVHFETWGLVLGARTASAGRMQLQAAGVRLEVEGNLVEGLRAGVAAAAWALRLDAPRSADPWTAYGMATLDWAQRWDAGAWISRELGSVSVTPALSVAQPAQPGALETRCALGVEWEVGPVRLRAEAAVARQTGAVELWMIDASAGVTMVLH